MEFVLNVKKNRLLNHQASKQQAVLLIVYYFLNPEEKEAFKPLGGAPIVHVLLSYCIFMIPMFMISMYRLFSSLFFAYVISIIYILQLGGVNCHCLIVQNRYQNIGNV